MIIESKCSKRNCKHYIGVINDGNELTERHSCKAFPDRIPIAIVEGKDLHKTPTATQGNEIVFEKN